MYACRACTGRRCCGLMHNPPPQRGNAKTPSQRAVKATSSAVTKRLWCADAACRTCYIEPVDEVGWRRRGEEEDPCHRRRKRLWSAVSTKRTSKATSTLCWG